MAITRVCHGAPVNRSSYSLFVLPLILPPTQDFFSRGVFPHISACRCAHGLCVNRSRMHRRILLNEAREIKSSPQPQLSSAAAENARVRNGEADLYSSSRLSLYLSLSEDSGNSLSCSECRLMLYSNWSAVGQCLSSMSVSIISKTNSYITLISGFCYSIHHNCQGVLIVVMYTVWWTNSDPYKTNGRQNVMKHVSVEQFIYFWVFISPFYRYSRCLG